MAYYTLNLGFDVKSNDHVINGDFLKDDAANPKPEDRSKVWLKSANPPAGQDVTFEFFAGDTTITVQPNDEVWVRVFSPGSRKDLKVRITAVFGRLASNSNQTLRSPFSLGNAGDTVCRAVFDSDTTPPNFHHAWLLGLGQITDRATISPSTYGFIVGATVWDGTKVYTFGHDPDMDVSTTGAAQLEVPDMDVSTEKPEPFTASA